MSNSSSLPCSQNWKSLFQTGPRVASLQTRAHILPTLPAGQAGYAVYKSIPYGSLEEVIPYLIRRAQENRSVLRGARREWELLSQELRRRLLGLGLGTPR